MISIVHNLSMAIQAGLSAVFRCAVPLTDIQLQPTPEGFSGTLTWVTFSFAKRCQTTPDILGNQIGQWLQDNANNITGFEVIKGFLNIEITDDLLLNSLSQAYQHRDFYKSPANKGTALVEFCSPNTNKPLHLGHLRTIFLGDAVSNILQATGYTVYKTNLVNDRGIHICKSMVAYQYWGKGETPLTSHCKGDHFVGKYYVLFEQKYKEQLKKIFPLIPNPSPAEKEQVPLWKEAQQMLQKWEAGDPEILSLWRQMNDWVLAGFEASYQRLGIHFDRTDFESETYLLGKKVVMEGLEKGVFFKQADGSVWIDLAAVGLGEKLLLRADGTAVYITQDMGTADLRYATLHASKMIYVVGNEQDYHFNVLSNIMQRLGRAYAKDLHHLSYGMVDLPNGRMKSREGTVVDADLLMDEMEATAASHTQALGKITGFTNQEAKELYHTLALGALKYFILRVDAKKRIVFDPQASIDFQGDTGTFIQYTHARIVALLQKAQCCPEQITIYPLNKSQLSAPLHPLEKTIILLIDQLPKKLEEAAANLAPALLTQYLLEIAKAYNRLYAICPILQKEDPHLRNLRLQISTVVRYILQDMMALLGIMVPDRM